MTHAHIIDALGEADAVAKELAAMTGTQLTRAAIYNWRRRGEIPHRWRPWIVSLSRKRGLSLSPEDLGLPVAPDASSRSAA